MALLSNGLFGTIAGKILLTIKSLPTIEVAPTRTIARALPNRALPMRVPEEIST